MATEIGRLVAVIDGDISGLQRAIAGAQKSLQSAGASMTRAGQSLTMGLTLPIVGIGALAAKASIDFESAFAGVRKTVDATAEQLDKLRTGIRGMAKEMPASAVEISKVAEAAGQLGIKTENILEFTRVMVMLGETTNLSANDAATALARIANIMQLPQDEFEKLGATLVDLGNKGASTEAEIVEMALRIAGAGTQVGLSADQVLAFANALSSVGIEAQAGGSAISRAFIEIANAAASGGDKLDEFARIAGMSSEEFARAFKEDAASAMVAFMEGLDRISISGENVFEVLDGLDLGEIRVRDALLRAANAGDLFAQSLRDGKQAWQEGTALSVEYGKRVETTAAKLEIFKNRLNDTMITLGDALVPVLMDVLEASKPLISAIEAMANGFASLPRPIQTAIVIMAAFVAVLGPLLIAVGLIAQGIGAIIAVMGVFGLTSVAAAGGVTGLAAAFGGLFLAAAPWLVLALAIGAGLYLLIKNWDDVTAAVSRAAMMIRDVAVGAFNTVLNFLRSNWPEVATLVAGPFAPLVALATDAFGVRSALISAFREVVQFLRGLPGEIVNAFGNLGDLLYNVGRALITGLWRGMSDVAGKMLGWVSELANRIANIFNRVLGIFSPSTVMTEVGQQTMAGLTQGLLGSYQTSVQPTVKTIAQGISSELQKYLNMYTAGLSLPALGESDPINVEATQKLLQLDPSAYGDPSKVGGFQNTIKALAAALDLNAEATGQLSSSLETRLRELTSLPDEQRFAREAEIRSLADQLGYILYEDLTISRKATGSLTNAINSNTTANADLERRLRELTNLPDELRFAAEAEIKRLADQLGYILYEDLTIARKAADGLKQLRLGSGESTAGKFVLGAGKSTEGMFDLGGAADSAAESIESLTDEADKATDATVTRARTEKEIRDAFRQGKTAEGAGVVPKDLLDKIDTTPVAKLKNSISEVTAASKEANQTIIDVQATIAEEWTAPSIDDLIANVDEIGQAADEQIPSLEAAGLSGRTAFQDMGRAASGLGGIIGSAFKSLEGINLGEKIGAAFSDAFEFLEGVNLGDKIVSTFESLSDVDLGVDEWVGRAFENATSAAGTGISNLVSFIGANFTAENLGRATAWLLLWPVEAFKQAFNAVGPVVSTFFGTTLPMFFLQTLPGLQASAQAIGVSIINGIASGISFGALTAFTFFTTMLPNTLISTAISIQTSAQQIGVSIINGIAFGLSSAAVAVQDFFLMILPGFISGAVTSVHGAAMSLGISIIEGIARGVTEAWQTIRAIPGDVVKALSDAFDAYKDFWFRIGQSIVRGLYDGIQSLAGWVQEQFGKFVKGFVDTASKILDIFSPSHVFENMGVQVVKGFAKGLEGMQDVDTGIGSLIGNAQRTIASAGLQDFAQPQIPRGLWQNIVQPLATPGQGGLTIQAYDTVVNNYDEMQDVDKAIADLAFAAAAQLRYRGYP